MFVEGASPSTHIRSRFPLHPSLSAVDGASIEGRSEVAMSDRRTELGFERTVCDCRACKINCEFIPGFLLPSDIRRIALHLGYSNPVEFALDNLLASPGAIVVDRGQIRRIRTLAPARRQDGACLFLDEEQRCRIHSVSPYGCSLSFAKTRFICVFNNFACLSPNQKFRDQNLILT